MATAASAVATSMTMARGDGDRRGWYRRWCGSVGEGGAADGSEGGAGKADARDHETKR